MRCCEQPENRDVVEQTDGKRVEVCVVCGCKHIKLTFVPFALAKPPEDDARRDEGNA